MGVMRFIVHPPLAVEQWTESYLAYIRAMDGRVFPTNVDYDGEVLTCRRHTSDSGKLSVPWSVSGHGRPVLNTTSLREREHPYLLPLELARGKLSEVRDQWATWEIARMIVPQVFKDVQAEAFHYFAHASANRHDLDVASQAAQQAIKLACDAADILADTYVVQRMTSIRRATSQAPSLLGCNLDEKITHSDAWDIFKDAFNVASIPIDWLQIEPQEGIYNWERVDRFVQHCTQNRMIIRGGPLINLGPDGMPKWLAPWKDDFFNLPSFVCDFIDTAISRYTGLIRIWEVSTAGNTGGALGLSEEHRLALVARTLETALRTDSDAQFFIRIDQPFGEYQRHGEHRLAPFQFVDALIRSNLGLSGISFDLNMGYHPPGSLARDMLSVSKLIDYWSALQVQIHVNLACPSSSLRDPNSSSLFEVDDKAGRQPWSEETQAEWIEQIVPLLMAKPSVTGVFLEQFSDSYSHRFPNAGLLDSNSNPKKMYDPLRRQLHHEMT